MSFLDTILDYAGLKAVSVIKASDTSHQLGSSKVVALTHPPQEVLRVPVP